MNIIIERFLPARRYASAGNSRHHVSVRPSVCLSVCLTHSTSVERSLQQSFFVWKLPNA